VIVIKEEVYNKKTTHNIAIEVTLVFAKVDVNGRKSLIYIKKF